MTDKSSSAASGEDRQELIEKRDKLIALLQKARVPSVISAGLGRRDGSRVLTVLVSGKEPPGIPSNFEGLPVVVTALGRALAL